MAQGNINTALARGISEFVDDLDESTRAIALLSLKPIEGRPADTVGRAQVQFYGKDDQYQGADVTMMVHAIMSAACNSFMEANNADAAKPVRLNGIVTAYVDLMTQSLVAAVETVVETKYGGRNPNQLKLAIAVELSHAALDMVKDQVEGEEAHGVMDQLDQLKKVLGKKDFPTNEIN